MGFRSLCDGAIDTTTASGELVFHIFSALAQFERRLIQERTRAGLAAARARGNTADVGRYARKTPGADGVHAVDRPASDVPEICRSLRISPATFYRYVALARQVPEETAREE